MMAMNMSGRFLPARIGAVLLLAVAALLQGCAVVSLAIAIPAVIGGTAMAVDPGLEVAPKAVTNKATLAYPTSKVYSALAQTVERNGREIVESTPAKYTLRVSYPFSLLANNWGGVITITCVPEGSDTTITILGSGRDSNHRLQKIGDEVVNDLKMFLILEPIGPDTSTSISTPARP